MKIFTIGRRNSPIVRKNAGLVYLLFPIDFITLFSAVRFLVLISATAVVINLATAADLHEKADGDSRILRISFVPRPTLLLLLLFEFVTVTCVTYRVTYAVYSLRTPDSRNLLLQSLRHVVQFVQLLWLRIMGQCFCEILNSGLSCDII